MTSEQNDAPNFKSLEGIIGIEEAIKIQKEKLESLRSEVKNLAFKKIDIAGNYGSITYRAFDGGKMKINFNPFEINVIDVADSNGNKKVSFVVPQISGYGDNDDIMNDVIKQLDSIDVIKKFVKLLNQKSISNISSVLKDSNNMMEIAEWACIFERATANSDDTIIIIKDGLLRTKAIKSEKNENYINVLIDICKQKKKVIVNINPPINKG